VKSVLGLGGGEDFFEILKYGRLDNRGGLDAGGKGFGGDEILQLIIYGTFEMGVFAYLVFRLGEFWKFVMEGVFRVSERIHELILTPKFKIGNHLFFLLEGLK
jgi:hypothetical protein